MRYPPAGVVSSEEFRELVQYLETKYVMPSRATVTKGNEIHYGKKKDEPL